MTGFKERRYKIYFHTKVLKFEGSLFYITDRNKEEREKFK